MTPPGQTLDANPARAVERQQQCCGKDREAGGILWRISGGEDDEQEDGERYGEESDRGDNVIGRWPVLSWQTFQFIPRSKGVDADPNRSEVEDRGQDCGDHNALVGHARQLNHHKRASAHQRRHDLPARGGDSFDPRPPTTLDSRGGAWRAA